MKHLIGKWPVKSFCMTRGVRLCLRSLVMMWSKIVEEDEVALGGIMIIGKAPILRTMSRYSVVVLYGCFYLY